VTGRRFWLVKSEADVYSIDDLARDVSTSWTGVRNYEARNLMRDEMSDGDLVLYYHSNASPPGVAGVARVRGSSRPDPSQFDPEDPYFDPRSSAADPRWWLVEIEFVEKFPRLVPLGEIRGEPGLSDMALLTRSRLSVQRVTHEEFAVVLRLAGMDAQGQVV